MLINKSGVKRFILKNSTIKEVRTDLYVELNRIISIKLMEAVRNNYDRRRITGHEIN